MKYTKYNYKKKSEVTKFFLSLALTTTIALSIGAIAARFLLKVMPSNMNIETKPIEEESLEATGDKIQNFGILYYVQCGYFSKEQNANDVLQKLNMEVKGFTSKDENEKYRVIAGVGNEEDVTKLVDKLNQKSIESAKIGVKLDKNNTIEEQILGILEGIIEINNTIDDKEVKNVNTAEFKEWTNALNEIEDGEKIEILNNLKKHVNEMPEEITSENSLSEIEYVFNIMRELPVKE